MRAPSADFKMPARGRIRREDYVFAEMEPTNVVRDQHGLPAPQLVDEGDRLTV